jgi:hypothetical protein
MRKTIIWVSFSLVLLALVIIAVGTRFVIPVLDDRSMPSGLYVRSFSRPQNGDIVTAKIIDGEANAHGISTEAICGRIEAEMPCC